MHVGLRFNYLLTKYFCILFCRLLILFFEINFLKNSFRNTTLHQSVKQFGYRRVWMGGGGASGIYFSLKI